MKTQSIDTQPETERVLISLIRKESLSEKLSQILSLSQTTIHLSKRAIARANRNSDIDQIKLLFINYHYGKDLAENVEKYMNKGNNEET
jgi:hypothetical protein